MKLIALWVHHLKAQWHPSLVAKFIWILKNISLLQMPNCLPITSFLGCTHQLSSIIVGTNMLLELFRCKRAFTVFLSNYARHHEVTETYLRTQRMKIRAKMVIHCALFGSWLAKRKWEEKGKSRWKEMKYSNWDCWRNPLL